MANTVTPLLVAQTAAGATSPITVSTGSPAVIVTTCANAIDFDYKARLQVQGNGVFQDYYDENGKLVTLGKYRHAIVLPFPGIYRLVKDATTVAVGFEATQ